MSIALPDSPGVTFKPLPCCDRHVVGDDGSIWIYLRSPRRAPPKWKRVVGYVGRNGYVGHQLHAGFRRYAHVLVLEAFVGPRPPGMECCHNDGNPVNNRLDNLRWDTHQENQRDALRHGRRKTGELSPNAKLSNQQVDEIRQLRASGIAPSVIARRFGINDSYVAQIINGRKRPQNVIPE